MKNKQFTFDFDIDIVHRIYEILQEHEAFLKRKKLPVTFKKKGEKTVVNFDVETTVYASLYRMEEALIYINSLKLPKGQTMDYKNAFDFCDFLNTMYIVTSCIEKLDKVFCNESNQLKAIKKSLECFNKPGKEGKGSDHRFFTYIRSLAAVHPIDTNRHDYYHGKENMYYSPFVSWASNILWNETDLYVCMFNPKNESEQIIETLQMKSFVMYLKKWINHLYYIAEAIITFYEETKVHFINSEIQSPDNCSTFAKYVGILAEEVYQRQGDGAKIVLEFYKSLFSVQLTNPINEDKVEEYRKAVRYSLTFLHKKMQTMDFDNPKYKGINSADENNHCDLYDELYRPAYINGELGSQHHTLEKLMYIDGSGCSSEIYARKLLDEVTHIINKYVIFTNHESAEETQVLIRTALYLESLNNNCLISRSVKNEF